MQPICNRQKPLLFLIPVFKNAPLRYRLIDECLCWDKVHWMRARLLEEVTNKYVEFMGVAQQPVPNRHGQPSHERGELGAESPDRV